MTDISKKSPAPERQGEQPEKTAVRGFRKTTGETLAGKLKRETEEFLYHLTAGNRELARHWGDIRHKVDLWEKIRQITMDHLKEGHLDTALWIGKDFGIPVESYEEYWECLRKQLVECLKKGEIITARDLKNKLAAAGERMRCEGYEEGVKEGVMNLLRRGSIDASLAMRTGFGHAVNFTTCEGYEETVREAFYNSLKQWRFYDACKIRNEYGKDMNLTLPEEYKGAVADKFIDLMENREIEAEEIHTAFNKEVDFAKHERYAEVMRIWFMREHPKLLRFLNLSREKPAAKTGFSSQKKPEPELLLRFEAMIIYVTGQFHSRIQEELRGGGSLGFFANSIDELSEKNQAKLQAFAANLHAELSAKIRAIASPELIRAYLEQNGGGTGSEFLTQVA